MTPLGDLLRRRIAATGPITIADFMSECLLHPEHGYYTTRDPFGADGDFTTAPEISQMFGELVGLCLAQAWLDQGAPDAVLAELGPGRGTLMADILRATQHVPGFLNRVHVHLVEASPTLRGRQRDTLAGQPITWCDSVATLPEAPLFLVANEFFDALPIRQFQRKGDGWSELQITIQQGQLAVSRAPALHQAFLEHRLADTQNGDIVETCAPAAAITGEVASRIQTFGGAALIIDYGDWGSKGDTFQALESHAQVDPLSRPGEADLTAHVDFKALASAATGVETSTLTPQGIFLERLGITQRAQTLAQNLSGAALDSHIAAHRRLTHPQEMGTLFKVVGFTPKGAPSLPGLGVKEPMNVAS